MSAVHRRLAIACAAAVLLAGSGRAGASPSQLGTHVDAWVGEHQRAIVGELARLVAIPNVKSDRAAMQRNAEALREMLSRRGFKVEIVPTAGSPLVLASRDAPGATRTLLLYAHYDGQPVEPARWTPPTPFAPVLRDGVLEDGAHVIGPIDSLTTFAPDWRLYGRSASDDKGPIVALCAALDALDANHVAATARVRVLLDGEEESGSSSLIAALPALKDRLRSDLMICFDGPGHPGGRPTIAYGVRGIVTLDLTVYGPKTDLHSGHYGNWVPNPAMRLAHLLASMKDDDGRVLVKGFEDGIPPLTAADQAMLRAVPDDSIGLLRRFGVAAPERPGLSLQQALQLPSLNVRGLQSAAVGPDARTVIPDHATASIDVRLVKETPAAAMIEKIRAHARTQGFHVVDAEPDDSTRTRYRDVVRISASSGTEGYRTDPWSAASKRVADAVAHINGEPPVLIRTMGGTLPIAPIAQALEVPVIVVPTVNFDNHQHSDNENIRLGHLFTSIRTIAALLTM